MEALLGTTWQVFIGITVVIIGFAAAMTGHGLANTWRPIWHVVLYCILLGGADRFLVFGLFEGELFLLSGYLIDTVVLIAISLLAFRLTQVNRMITQYPWLYERAGLFAWRDKQ